MKRLITKLLAVGLLGLTVGCAQQPAVESSPEYTDFDKMTPDATFEFESKSFKLLLGGGWGEGVLTYQGKSYPFKAKSGSVGGVGYKNVKVSGNVYRLNSIEDFTGFYTAGTVGATAGSKSRTGVALENGNKVVMRITDDGSTGLQLSVSLGTLHVSME